MSSAYCGAKSEIRGFIDSVRCEMIHDGSNIRIRMVQMPALNTPQFGWVKSRLPRNPQPVPAIFRPEVAAEAIYFAAYSKRRELYVGFPTINAVVANMVFAGLLDVYLAKTGYKAQQTDQPVSPDRKDNLWEALPGDHGAQGTSTVSRGPAAPRCGWWRTKISLRSSAPACSRRRAWPPSRGPDDPQDLGLRLRHGAGSFLPQRRGVVGASVVALGSLSVIALYQVGIIGRLPDPPLPGFNAGKVHGSAEAYAMLATPDAVLGLGSYAVTTALAVMGGKDRPTAQPWLPLALAGKVLFDLAQAGRLTRNAVRVQHALSAWSLLTTGATCVTAALVVPETRAAL